MSSTIKQAILSLKSRIADAYTAIANKGGTLPATQDSANLPTTIASIPSGGGDMPWHLIIGARRLFMGSKVEEFDVISHEKWVVPTDTSDMFRDSYVANINIDDMAGSVTNIASFANATTRLKNFRIGVCPDKIMSFNQIVMSSSVEMVYIGGSMERANSAVQMFASDSELLEATLPQIGSNTNYIDITGLCYGDSKLTKITLLGNVYASNIWRMIFGCQVLQKITGGIIDLTNCTNAGQAFNNCSALEEIMLYNLGVSTDLSYCTNLTYASLLYLVQNLQNVSGQVLTLGNANKAKLEATAEGQAAIAAAQSNGWTIS